MEATRQLRWKGFEYASKEHCSVSIGDEEILINGRIRSRPADIDLDVTYALRLSLQWETTHIRILGSVERTRIDYDLQRSAAGWVNWDGRQFGAAADPDISLTPLTNTLPLRRLPLQQGASALIEVLYFDLAAGSVDVRQQRYTRLSETGYRFETVPADFEAEIEFDADGFLAEYPGLFSRIP